VVGRAPSVLGSRRAAAFAALLAVDVVYYVWHGSLPTLPYWGGVAFAAFPLIPAVLLLDYVALPVRERRGLLPVAAAIAVLAWACVYARWGVPAAFAKLTAATLVGWWFLIWFEAASWVVLVACVVPFVDAYSVFSKSGPTHQVVTHHAHVFEGLAIAFPLPGHGGAYLLGPPDILFFALFVGAAARFGLRLFWTWALCTLSFGATVALASAVSLSGLPALPLLSVGFLAANADVLWRRRRAARDVETNQ
jgi:hypothetical protein